MREIDHAAVKALVEKALGQCGDPSSVVAYAMALQPNTTDASVYIGLLLGIANVSINTIRANFGDSYARAFAENLITTLDNTENAWPSNVQ